jgi:NADPH:quinone reductase-like Zn-dependent oxidoreductase
MLAVQIQTIGQPPVVVEVPVPVPGEGEVLVKLKAAALNHRDIWINQGKYPKIQLPCVPGSDGSGTVVALGEGVEKFWSGQDVVINPGYDWGMDEAAGSAQFTILGMPRQGTLAQYIAVPVGQLAAKPAHLKHPDAAAVPLAGVTAFRAVFSKGNLAPGDKVLVTGIGGGVALMALQFALGHGAEVWVTSGSEAKIARAVSLGAKGGAIYKEEGWAKKLGQTAGLFDLIVDSGGGPDFPYLIDLAAPGGRIACFGGTAGSWGPIIPGKVFFKQLQLLGTTMGSPRDFAAMMEWVGQHRMKPVVDQAFPMAQAPDAFKRMDEGQQFGKIVLEIP